jgi:hypothetical protein
VYWIPAVVFLVHVAEELPRFPAWATRHFGATSRAYFVYSHIVMVPAVVVVSVQAQAAAPRTTWPMVAVAFMWVLGTNALFHIATTVLFREYSPGLVTGVLLAIPATGYLVLRVRAMELLTGQQLAAALVIGTVVSGLVICSLWLHLDFDWRLRRPPSSPPL